MTYSVLATANLIAGYIAQVDILNGVTITVAKNEIVTVVGPNGAGKSTLLKTLVGLIVPKSGRVILEGDDITG
jgi:ABC-type branched-subunit amino acid transport system ATPase component